MPAWTCPGCGLVLADSIKTCPNCGTGKPASNVRALAQPNTTRAVLLRYMPTVHRCTLETCRKDIIADKRTHKRQAVQATIYDTPGTFQVRTEHFHPACYDGRWGPLMEPNRGFVKSSQRAWAG